ncbi:hypothetical protein GQR58_010803 [Nymphon striatum]|nr:hypothetical protein GQR58_010803 [Nymphon striatum]
MDELNVKLSHTSKFENAAKDTVTLTKKQLQAILAAFNASEDKEIEDKEKLIRFKRNEEIEDEQDHHTKSKLGCYESSNLKNRKTNSLDRKKLPKLSPESDFSKFDLKKLQWKKERGKANIWCKYYLLRQYSSSLSAAESSTLMTTDDGTMSSSSTSNNYGVVLLQV